MPRCVSVISNLADACGVFVPIPTFWADTDENKKVGTTHESMFNLIAVLEKWLDLKKNCNFGIKNNQQRYFEKSDNFSTKKTNNIIFRTILKKAKAGAFTKKVILKDIK